MLPTLLRNPGFSLTISQQGIHTRGYISPGLAGSTWPRHVLAVIKCIYLPPTYLHFIQDIEDRCLLLTSSTSFVDLPFQEHRMTEKVPCRPKSMHIFIMSKIRHSKRQYDMRKWRGTKHGLNWAKVWPTGYITLADRPYVGAFPKIILSTCLVEAVLKVSNAQR
jgi:hypothetical protein